jgi:hypothetical protein
MRFSRTLPAGLALLLAAALAATAPAAAPPLTDRFIVDASVGGVVRRDLREIGKAALQYVPLDAQRFRMRGAAEVVHREKRKLYKFQLDMSFQLAGRRLAVTENKSVFAGDAAELRDKVERVVPFLYLARTLPVPGPAEEPVRTWLAKHGYFVMRYARRERGVEATLHQDDALVARLQLTERPGRAPDLEKIAIPAAESVMVEFTRKRPGEQP